MFDWLKKWREPKFTASEVQEITNRMLAAEREKLVAGLAEKRRAMRDDMQATMTFPDNAILAEISARRSDGTPFTELTRRLWDKAPDWAKPRINPALRIVHVDDGQLVKLMKSNLSVAHIGRVMLHTRKPHYHHRADVYGTGGRWTRYVLKEPK